MTNIKYIIGDATYPIGEGNKIIPHVCNDIRRWGSGFVLALSKRWKEPEEVYRSLESHDLGATNIVWVEEDIYVANMIAQHGIGLDLNGDPPIRYNALKTALKTVNDVAVIRNASLHCPKFGAGLAGGDWKVIEKIIEEVVTVPTTIYVLNERDLP